MTVKNNNASNNNATKETVELTITDDSVIINGEVVDTIQEVQGSLKELGDGISAIIENEKKNEFEEMMDAPLTATEQSSVKAKINPFIKEEDMNAIKETEGKLAAASKVKHSHSVDPWSIGAAAGIAAIGITAQLVVTNIMKDEVELEGSRYSALQVAGRALGGATLAAGLNYGAQKLSAACATDPAVNMLTTALIGNGVRVADAFFGDQVMNMFSAGASAASDKVNSLFEQQEEEVQEAVEAMA